MLMQTIATEVKNIFWGLAKCLMYNPGQVKEKEWMSLLAIDSIYIYRNI